MSDPLGTARPFFDPARLSALVGADVVARRLRHKPGLSTVAALHSPDGIFGWAQVATRAHDAKIEKAIRRAERHGHRIHLREVDGMTLAFGAVDSDPMLVKAFDEVPDAQRMRAVRYNPQRRAVFRTEVDGVPASLRLQGTAGEPRAAIARNRALVAEGIATTVPIARTRRTSIWPWVGATDLAALAPELRPEAARLAGAELARLHAAAPAVDTAIDITRLLVANADGLSRLDPELGARLRGLIGRLRLTDADVVASHGDFSADQVAVGDGQIWLLDFDRHGTAPRGLDLGSFHATELLEHDEPVTSALLEGYGGPGLDELRGWVFAGLASRIAEPFRDADPDWRARISARLDQMEEWVR